MTTLKTAARVAGLRRALRAAVPTRTPRALRWADWAEALSARHASIGSSRGSGPLTLRRRVPATYQRGGPTFVTRPSFRIGYSPIVLTLNLSASPARQAAVPRLRLAVARAAIFPAVNAPGAAATSLAVNTAGPFAARLIERETRLFRAGTSRIVERLLARVAAAPTATPRDVGRPPAPPPVERVLARPNAPQVPAATEAVGGFARPEPFASLPYWADAPRAAPAPALDVERLTDQVIRSIDRRVTAARERLGRR